MRNLKNFLQLEKEMSQTERNALLLAGMKCQNETLVKAAVFLEADVTICANMALCEGSRWLTEETELLLVEAGADVKARGGEPCDNARERGHDRLLALCS